MKFFVVLSPCCPIKKSCFHVILLPKGISADSRYQLALLLNLDEASLIFEYTHIDKNFRRALAFQALNVALWCLMCPNGPRLLLRRQIFIPTNSDEAGLRSTFSVNEAKRDFSSCWRHLSWLQCCQVRMFYIKRILFTTNELSTTHSFPKQYRKLHRYAIKMWYSKTHFSCWILQPTSASTTPRICKYMLYGTSFYFFHFSFSDIHSVQVILNFLFPSR